MWIMTEKGWRRIVSVCVNENDVQGVFRPVSAGQAAAETVSRALAYERDVNRYIRGEITKQQIFNSMTVPIFGAFRETL